jgi:hypothetical protein
VRRYLLDTNVLSELRKSKPHGGVIAWLNGLRDEQLFVSAVTIGELQAGVERTRRNSPEKAQIIEEWIDQVAGTFQVLPMDVVCFREWARLMEGKSEHLLEDVMIAATARVHGLVVATRNERDFGGVEVEVVNPFLADPSLSEEV